LEALAMASSCNPACPPAPDHRPFAIAAVTGRAHAPPRPGAAKHHTGMAGLKVALAALALLPLAIIAQAGAAPPTAAALPDDATLEAAGARVGKITVITREIFDVSDPRENYALYRLANRLHRTTRDGAVQEQLLFHTGDRYQARLLRETERNLRQLEFLREPRVRPVAWHDGLVDIVVETHDVWTLQISPSYARSGGRNEASFEVKDVNLLGFGKTLAAGYSKGVDRNSTYFEWRDPAVFYGHWKDVIHWAQNSDGHDRSLQVYRPFYSLDVHHAGGLTWSDGIGTDTRYRLGDEYDHYHHALRLFDLQAGWSPGLRAGHVLRLTGGWHEERDDFNPEFNGDPPVNAALAPIPADRDLVYPFVQLEWLTDDFETTRNREQIARTEDVQLGPTAMLQLGYAAPAFGADRHALIASGRVGCTWQLTRDQQLSAEAGFSGRLEQGRVTDLRSGLKAAWFWRTSRRTLTHVLLAGDTGQALDLDHYFLLGGDNGLRGYPLRYQQGSSRAQFSIEERLFTDWSLWRLLDVGGAVFFDTGRTYGGNPVGAPQLGWLRDVGIGLRLGNNRSSLGNVLHVDVAAPLDGQDIKRLQLLVGAFATF
jgi:hypothetical protein